MSVSSTMKIKVLSKGLATVSERLWRRQLPTDTAQKNGIAFSFDPQEREYDWLVVYDDLPKKDRESTSRYIEHLACPPQNTLLVTAEPPSIKLYSSDFCRQFGWILSSQEPWAIRHPNLVTSQFGLRWFYGHGQNHTLSYEQIADHPPTAKTKDLSVVCSSKTCRRTLHSQRVAFVEQLKRELPEMDVFGHGVRPINDKAESLDSYRYHIAIENHFAAHHWTEKLSDAFLGCTLPFYCGASDAADYFPAESFIPIDLTQPEESADVISRCIENNEFDKRVPAIMEARRRILEQHQLFPNLCRLVRGDVGHSEYVPANKGQIISRYNTRLGILSGARYLGERLRNRLILNAGKRSSDNADTQHATAEPRVA